MTTTTDMARQRDRAVNTGFNMTCSAITDLNQTLIALGVTLEARKSMLIAIREHTNELIANLK